MVIDMGMENLPEFYDLKLVGAATLLSSAEISSLLPTNSLAAVGDCLTGILYGDRSIPLISLPVLVRSSPEASADDEPEDSGVLRNVPFLLNLAFPFSYISYEFYDDLHAGTDRKLHRRIRHTSNRHFCQAQVAGRLVDLNCAREHQNFVGVNLLGADFCRQMKAKIEFDYLEKRFCVRPQVEE